MLLYFFHHVADSLQAASVIRLVSEELEEVIKQEYSFHPATFDAKQIEVSELRQKLLNEGEGVESTGEGYVRAIDYNKLIDIATKQKIVLNIKCLPGDFVNRGDELLTIWPGQGDKQMISTINHAYMLGRNRTLLQDTEYGLTLIVIIAVRALSSAINDPYTPRLCLDRLGAALGMLAERATPQSYYLDREPTSSYNRTDRFRAIGRCDIQHDQGVQPRKCRGIDAYACNHQSEQDSRIGLASKYDQQRVHDSYQETLQAINQT
jgi:uncharacterized membrane protein